MTSSRAEGARSRRARFPSELLDPSEMARADAIAARTIPSHVLMERAGEAVAHAALRLVGPAGKRRIFVLCGPGNNGGDGYVAARKLAEAGCAVDVVALVHEHALKGDAAQAAERWTGPVLSPAAASFDAADLIVDALFGAGLSREIDGEAAALVERVNAWATETGNPLLAVDVPSGVDGASGATRGPTVQASDCVTFFRLKPGHILMPGRTFCGTLALADIGIESCVLDEIRPTTVLNAPAYWRSALPEPTLAGHKYARGHAVVVSGPMAQTGAARLAARAALRAGAGLVTVATPADALPILAATLTAVMTRVADDAPALAELLADPRKNAVLLGPGLGVGAGTRALVEAALAAAPSGGSHQNDPPRAVVLDADALTSFADEPETLFALIAASRRPVVLTPHDGEFARLFGRFVAAGDAKPKRARAAAAMSGAVVVLKGPDTVVASPEGEASIAASQAPWLATAGTGDVLAGMITGLLAQSMPPFAAASAAVWMHAEAARLFGPGLISEDLSDMLPKVLGELFEPS